MTDALHGPNKENVALEPTSVSSSFLSSSSLPTSHSIRASFSNVPAPRKILGNQPPTPVLYQVIRVRDAYGVGTRVLPSPVVQTLRRSRPPRDAGVLGAAGEILPPRSCLRSAQGLRIGRGWNARPLCALATALASPAWTAPPHP